MAATECFICGLSLANYDEPAATFHLNGCLDEGSSSETQSAGAARTRITSATLTGPTAASIPANDAREDSRLSSAGLVFMARPATVECPICGQAFNQDVLEDHVEACLLSIEQTGSQQGTNGHSGTSASGAPNGLHSDSMDSCPCCLLEWSAIDIPFSERDLHVADCLAQQSALAEDDDDGSEADGGVNAVTEQELRNMLNGRQSNARGFGRLKSAFNGKGKNTHTHVTAGLVPVLQKTLEQAMLSSHSPTRLAVLCNTNVLHIKSQFGDFGWGCGYKSACMVFSAIRHVDSYRTLLLGEQTADPSTTGSEISTSKRKAEADGENAALASSRVAPLLSIEQMQEIAEEAWKAGFDPAGKRHFNGKLVGSKRWIGTSEVYIIFTWLGIRAKVIDFPRSPGGLGAHSTLAKWVFDYFRVPLDESVKGKDAFGTLMNSGGSAVRICEDRMPLYLQHQGHSRTIVGVEQTKSGDLNLLLFDCGKKVTPKLKEATEIGGRVTKKAKSPTTSTSATGESFTASKLVEPYRVNLKDLSKKDEYQILCVETEGGPLSLMEKLGRRKITSTRIT